MECNSSKVVFLETNIRRITVFFIPVKDILTSNVIKNLSQDDVNTIIGNMRDISSSNKYFKEIKSLTLKR